MLQHQILRSLRGHSLVVSNIHISLRVDYVDDLSNNLHIPGICLLSATTQTTLRSHRNYRVITVLKGIILQYIHVLFTILTNKDIVRFQTFLTWFISVSLTLFTGERLTKRQLVYYFSSHTILHIFKYSITNVLKNEGRKYATPCPEQGGTQ